MENINALVKTIIVVTFIWSLSERLLSRSNIVKYTEFVYGLVIMTITVSSIINIKPYEFIPDISGAQKTTHYTQDYLKQVYEEVKDTAFPDQPQLPQNFPNRHKIPPANA